MTQTLMVILMGSKADEPHSQKIAEAAQSFGIDVVMRIGSAHKTPQHVIEMLKTYEADPRPKVYVTVAGRSNALSGFVDASVKAPVVACPPASEAFGGADLFSSLRMPSGVAPAVVLDPANAALFAAKILAQHDPLVLEKLSAFQQAQIDKIFRDDAALK
jgi:phosphoribosylaminoimidazole carboxylase PurE protein